MANRLSHRRASCPYPTGEKGAWIEANILDPEGKHTIGHAYDPQGPMPLTSAAYIRDKSLGIRSLQDEEIARVLGIPDSWDCGNVGQKTLCRSTCYHMWAALELSLSEHALEPGNLEPSPPDGTNPTPTMTQTDKNEWDWERPNLDEDGPWWRARRRKLWRVTETCKAGERAKY